MKAPTAARPESGEIPVKRRSLDDQLRYLAAKLRGGAPAEQVSFALEAIAEELGQASQPAWRGWLLTLNCGHLELTDLRSRLVGQLTTCDMCPLTTQSPGKPTRQIRVIVDRQPVTAPAEPATVDPSYWYST